ncbi:ceramide glucosyltransferase [Sphingomonas vulcanisoli]|uniref:Ceramide glucosyltransferase n=1 Tax=Sphingomonas vulcanisoli TaxID=1658060 RepID=A0ABX0TQP3_9SPHN|nr:bacteriohopanetetrol glucosamine biosynthesis glycosyltransferase HpnI [Sphingomonas vulcanisoli]NIJ07852.1 ceramide glucosyltransferase [Sphingomonas vulcanisoli]
MATILAWLLCMLAIGGMVTTLYSAVAVARFAGRKSVVGPAEPVSLLKPLHGAEPGLADNLAGFFDQDWDAPIQMVTGVQRADDPAREVLHQFRHSRAGGSPLGTGAASPLEGPIMDPRLRGDDEISEVVDPTSHGANAKVSNLINMLPVARHDLIVISDDDMRVPRDYLAMLAGALAAPQVGAVTCVYRGEGVAGRWSRLSAAGASYHFLPAVVMGLSLGLAKPCMGSTIALRRATLAAIGGFEGVADTLADDYAIGAKVRALGLDVVLPPMLLVHEFPEAGLGALWRHELRWQKTLRIVDPIGNAGMVFTYPLPFALALIPLMPRLGLTLTALAFGARLLLKRIIDRWAGAPTCSAWMLFPRDILALALYLRAFVVRSVDWRGQQLVMAGKGRVTAQSYEGPAGLAE